jgi:hypothetical protein
MGTPYSCGGDFDRGESGGRDQICFFKVELERELELEAELVQYSRLNSSIMHLPPQTRLVEQPISVPSILLLCYAMLCYAPVAKHIR